MRSARGSDAWKERMKARVAVTHEKNVYGKQ